MCSRSQITSFRRSGRVVCAACCPNARTSEKEFQASQCSMKRVEENSMSFIWKRLTHLTCVRSRRSEQGQFFGGQTKRSAGTKKVNWRRDTHFFLVWSSQVDDDYWMNMSHIAGRPWANLKLVSLRQFTFFLSADLFVPMKNGLRPNRHGRFFWEQKHVQTLKRKYERGVVLR